MHFISFMVKVTFWMSEKKSCSMYSNTRKVDDRRLFMLEAG